MKINSIEELYDIYLTAPILSKDTREISKGCIYLALKGENFDGNKFAKDAIEKGANFAIIDNPQYDFGDNYLLVDNVLSCLQDLAKYHRNKLDIPVIAVSGSNGKTTTKELIASTLSEKFNVLFTAGNYNNHIGVPLTLLRINSTHELAIIEMGANHQGEIDFLCRIAKPNYGLLTNIGKAHLEGFGGELGVLKGKTELFRYLEQNNGTSFINLDDSKIAANCPSKNTISYSLNNVANCEGTVNTTHPSLKGTWKTSNYSGTINSSLYGEYNFHNILAACCIANYFGVDGEKIDRSISNYTSDMNRSQLVSFKTNMVYLDAYNANPTSMGLSLQNFDKVNSENKIAIIGDMFEVGDAAFVEHKTIVELARSLSTIKQFVFVGALFLKHKESFPSALFFETTEECKTWFSQASFKESTLLLKGSRGMKLESLLVP